MLPGSSGGGSLPRVERNSVKVVHVNHWDASGGATRSTVRLHQGLLGLGQNSSMLVLKKTLDDPTIHELQGLGARFISWQGWRIDRLPTTVYRHRDRLAPWSVNWFPYTNQWRRLDADIVHLHWIGLNYLPMASWPQLPHPVVWTLKDSWAFTGGCHIPYECRRYEDACGKCPILHSEREHDLSRRTWQAKARAFPRMKPVIITPSRWLADSARSSSLLRDARIEVIPNSIDTDRFKPASREAARIALGLPLDKTLIAFGAFNLEEAPNKGYALLNEALSKQLDHAELVLYGTNAAPANISRKAYPLGTIRDESTLATLFNAVDLVALPSRSENLPNTIIEAFACGTPVVAFRIGGIPDLIDHQVNGYMADPFDTDDLARGIAWMLEDPERHARLCAAARDKVEREYEVSQIARRHLELYEDIRAAGA
ncbi:MAG: glycosyltransferase family 4 protein [Anaerolineae bacterium]